MAENTTYDGIQYDPYRTFRFQILIDKRPVAGLRKMSALKKTTESILWRTAGAKYERKLPGSTKFEPVVLEQGLSLDPVFENWAGQVNSKKLGDRMSLAKFRKDITIQVMNFEGDVAISYKLFNAWVSEYQALPDLDAGTTNTVGIQTIKLEFDGWERDEDVKDETPRTPQSE